MKEEVFPNCSGDCKFKINCGRFKDTVTFFYCLKNKCIYQKKTAKERREIINNEVKSK